MSTVTTSPATALRVLPARLRESIEPNLGRFDVEVIARAYQLSEKAHRGQKRASGEEYIAHCVEVAKILADLHLDSTSVAVGLVHDVVEDTLISLPELRETLGDEIANIVDGVTKIGKVQFRSNTEQQVENYRKLLLSMAQDARVILIKLADRVHNMRTLEHLRADKRRRIALETREIYAPLAHRLGMAQIRWELEDLTFKHLEPESYRELARKVAERRKEREEQIEALRAPLRGRAAQSRHPLRGVRPSQAPVVDPAQDGAARPALR